MHAAFKQAVKSSRVPSLPNARIQELLKGLDGQNPAKTDQIRAFATKLDEFEALETVIAEKLEPKALASENEEPLPEMISNLQSSVEQLKQQVVATWEFESQDVEDAKDVWMSRMNPRALGVVTDLHLRLTALETRLATFVLRGSGSSPRSSAKSSGHSPRNFPPSRCRDIA